MKIMLTIAKLVTVLFWVAVISTGFTEWAAPLDKIIPALGGLVFVAHVLEIVIWQSRIRSLSDHVASDNIKILIFGAFHMATLSQAESETADSQA